MELKKITNYLNNYFEINSLDEYSYNGLQVEGKSEVKKILFTVDIGCEIVEHAIKEDYDMIIVHHGLYWKGENPSINNVVKKRIAPLIKNDISLYAVHLPLDKHPEIGNNAQLLDIIKAKKDVEFMMYKGTNIGWIGRYENETDFSEIKSWLDESLGIKSKSLEFGPKKITKIGICSGGGSRKDMHEAISLGAQAFITGEESEWYQDAKDYEINVIFAGHHASETVGVKALSKEVSHQFEELECNFVDFPTGL